MKIKLEDIIFAIETTDQYTENFLDAETGKIEWINDMTMSSSEKEEVYERLDEHGFYRLPTNSDIQDYDIMEDFISGLPPRPQEYLMKRTKLNKENIWYQGPRRSNKCSVQNNNILPITSRKASMIDTGLL